MNLSASADNEGIFPTENDKSSEKRSPEKSVRRNGNTRPFSAEGAAPVEI